MPDTNVASTPLRILQVGAGGMGRWWLRVIAASADAELVGLVDLDVTAARAAADAAGFEGVPVAATVAELSATQPQALLDVAIPVAHYPINTAALFAGFPVLSEKPLAETVAQALSMAAASELTGQLLMVSQSRRYFPTLDAFRRQLSGLGQLALVSCEFAKSLDLGGFRSVMPQPLLVDMAIHHFDLARMLTGAEPLSVYCETSNPPWSRFQHDSVAAAVFEFAGGIQFSYTGSWSSPGLETSWNGRWRISAEHGTAVWDGDNPPFGADADEAALAVDLRPGPQEIDASLVEFVAAVRTGATPQGEVHSNVISLAMVEAAVASAESGQRVRIVDVLETALAQAIRDESHPGVKAVLESWPSAAAALGLGLAAALG